MNQTWFECKVKFQGAGESGNIEVITEVCLIDAISYTEAEARLSEEMESIAGGGTFQIDTIKKTKITEIFAYDAGEWWYKIVINMTILDEEEGRSKNEKIQYMIMADDIQQALTRINASLESTMVPYTIISLSVSGVIDVFEYKKSLKELAEEVLELTDMKYAVEVKDGENHITEKK